MKKVVNLIPELDMGQIEEPQSALVFKLVSKRSIIRNVNTKATRYLRGIYIENRKTAFFN